MGILKKKAPLGAVVFLASASITGAPLIASADPYYQEGFRQLSNTDAIVDVTHVIAIPEEHCECDCGGEGVCESDCVCASDCESDCACEVDCESDCDAEE